MTYKTHLGICGEMFRSCGDRGVIGIVLVLIWISWLRAAKMRPRHHPNSDWRHAATGCLN